MDIAILWEKFINYKWQFVRRNEEYRKDYQEYIQANDTEVVSRESMEIDLSLKWGGFVINPENESLNLSNAGIGSPLPGVLNLIRSHQIREYLNDSGKVTKYWKNVILENPYKRKIIVEFDLESPDWLILLSLQNLIKSIRTNMRLKEKRIQWDKLDLYLKIYDMKNVGHSIEEIANIIFLNNLDDMKDDKEDEKESAIRKVRRYLKKANEMVQNGQIT